MRYRQDSYFITGSYSRIVTRDQIRIRHLPLLVAAATMLSPDPRPGPQR